ncbi:cyclin-A1 isoform X2 [Bacillus rossius redtenbacheri]|uniref:cyclin-A1 isoform X2 n=1 Tax=Bacillus rossius redtenbacheri TaxID=93214 RepID=UPI002FDD9133
MASFAIHEDQENNVNPKEKRAPLHKRSVLGVLNVNKVYQNLSEKELKQEPAGNSHATKPEPGRPKQKGVAAAAVTRGADKPSFTIYEEPAAADDARSGGKENELPDDVISLHKPRGHAPSPMALDRSREESPMLVDCCRVRPQPEPRSFQLHLLEVSEYKEDVHAFMRQAEKRHRPKPGYMRKQPDITYSMRAILVDWLVEVAEEYRLQAETLHLAVSYVDRFLSYMSVMRAKLQLVGTAAMFVAAKYEEIYPPDVNEFVYITDDTYTKSQVLRMEHLILKVLAFDMSVPTTYAFLTIYCSFVELPETVVNLALYLCELSLLEADPYLEYLPSEKAAAAVAVARHQQGLEAWSAELERVTGYSLQQLRRCIASLGKTHAGAGALPQQAVQDKYKAQKWQCVSLLKPRTPALLQ